MIEYKAECGHVLEATDEDAGKLVRCSICGRTSTVPGGDDSGFDTLLDKVEQREPITDAKSLKRRRDKRLAGRRAKREVRPGQIDPLGIVLKMCYAAALLVIVIYVGKRYVIPLLPKDGPTKAATQRGDAPSEAKQGTGVSAVPTDGAAAPGLIDRPLGRGLYVSSVPSGAMVFCVEASQAPPRGRIRGVGGCVKGRATGGRLPISADGTYVVEVVLPWNAPGLNDPTLPLHESYLDFRRSLEAASDDERRSLIESFFVPDDAWSVFADQTDEQIYLVRQYRNVEIREGRSLGVRALFLPWIRPEGGNAIDTRQLVEAYIPDAVQYRFDAAQARAEMNYYGVPESQQSFVREALARIGVIPFVTADGRTRLFKIGIDDGAFSSRVVREAEP